MPQASLYQDVKESILEDQRVCAEKSKGLCHWTESLCCLKPERPEPEDPIPKAKAMMGAPSLSVWAQGKARTSAPPKRTVAILRENWSSDKVDS